MNKIVSLLVLALVSTSTFAAGSIAPVPEPEILPLLAIGFAGLFLAKRKK